MSKFFTILLASLFLNSANYAFTKKWGEVFDEKGYILQNNCYDLIKNQYNKFANQESPMVASPLIKAISINENDEKLIDIRIMKNSRISLLPDSTSNQSFASPDCNSGLPSASKMRLGIYNKLEKMLDYLDELAENFGCKPGTISIKVFEGLRDLKTQTMLFQNKFNEIKAKNSQLTDEEVEAETAKWVSPVKNNIPVHSTGAAVDIRLWNTEINDFVDLGKFGVIWGENKGAPTFSESISDQQKLNRLYFLVSASKAGLVNYSYEYWHFSAGDRYAMYWQEKDADKRIACYGAVK